VQVTQRVEHATLMRRDDPTQVGVVPMAGAGTATLAPAVEPAGTKPRAWKRTVWTIAAVLTVGGLAYGWHAFSQARHGSSSPNSSDGGPATLGFATAASGRSAAAVLETVPAEVTRHNRKLRLTGTLVADEKAAVASNVSGILTTMHVDRGSVVHKNDVLAQLDPVDAQNRLAEGQALLEELKARLGLDRPEDFKVEEEPEVRLAKASLELAEANLKRAEELYGKKVISTEGIDQVRTEAELAMQRYRQTQLQVRQTFAVYNTALAKLKILEKAVADTTIRAPFDGWVAEKLVMVGEQVTAGFMPTPLVTLVRVDPLRLSLTVPQQDIGHVRQGQAVQFRVDSHADRTFEGCVRYIAPVVADNTRSMIVEAVVPNPDGLLRPGVFATAELELAEEAPQIHVPLGAVQRSGEVARVFVVRDGAAREQVVSLGAVQDGRIEVQSGLRGDERLVARPELVRDGDAVPQ
jgi:RND family efflux transporter MFP subunit